MSSDSRRAYVSDEELARLRLYSRPPVKPPEPPRNDRLEAIIWALGFVLFVAGFALILVGGILAATQDGGGSPYYLQAYVWIIPGLLVMALGSFLMG